MSVDYASVRAKMAQYDRDGLTTGKTNDQLNAFIDDALLSVPVSALGPRATLATAYYALNLMGGATGASSGGGAIKREKSGDIEIEYAVSAKASSSGNWYLDQYQAMLGSRRRNSPRVLGAGSSA
ncbi:MAG: DUF4054 domain-containing protein [Candidatus Sericytochromatia bacterium]|nr:DUF4054 domain-containing protein [Candidatus Sericytochromatia bacterium]